jgi:hypothetical protein
LQALLERYGGKIAGAAAVQQDGVACGDAVRAESGHVD